MRSGNKYFLSEEEPVLNPQNLDAVIRRALVEDIGKGDITTRLTVPEEKKAKGIFLVKEDCVICGLKVAERVFQIVDKRLKYEALAQEGEEIKSGSRVAAVYGKARSILTCERLALNLLSMLSGIASRTREFVNKIEPLKTKITDTRKTFPGLRELQKYAVRVGGGYNHRMGLDEMILIKDNHLKISDGYERLPSVPKGFKIEIETNDLGEFRHALKFKPDCIMLDNMGLADIREAVKIRDSTEFKSHHPKTLLEASGGINLQNIRDIAETGVEIISVGELTHSVQAVDISLEVEDSPQ